MASHDDPHPHDSVPGDGSPGRDGAPRVGLLVREGCHLCVDAEAEVARVCGRLGESYRLIRGEDEPALLERHHEEIPVLFVDGVQRDFWRVDPVRLERLLTLG